MCQLGHALSGSKHQLVSKQWTFLEEFHVFGSMDVVAASGGQREARKADGIYKMKLVSYMVQFSLRPTLHCEDTSSSSQCLSSI